MEFSINITLKIGDNLWTVTTAHLVYLNHQDLCSDSPHQMMSYWLDQKLANTYYYQTKLACIYDKNILYMHLKRYQHLKNYEVIKNEAIS